MFKMLHLKRFLIQIKCTVLFLLLFNINLGYGVRKYTKEDLIKLREEVRQMFNHAYTGYLKYAYPYDELRPLTCDGVDTWGSYSLTLIDALDTLAVMGNYSEFRRVVDIVVSKADFDANINVSVFETNIRIIGGLLSAHLLSQRAGVDLEPGWPCNGPLLRLAEDVAKRLIAAFDTSTGMPYGTVNLRHGVPSGETTVTCTAGVGTFILEFGSLSRLTGDPIYEEVALNALHALYHHRSSIGLYGNHIDVMSGRWTGQDSGIGAGVDSYFEYLVKGALLIQRPELMAIFNDARTSIDKHLKRNDWYLWASMYKGQVTLPVFQSLEAYWPGVLSLIGDISGGMKSLHNYHQVWKQYGFTPEFYNIVQGQVGTNRESYPLRPELIESAMYLYRATGDPFLLDVGTDILRSIQHSARTKCGYATIKDCRDHSLENRMESFFLAETTKYLYLLFDPDNFIHNNGQTGRVHTLPSGRECILDAGGYIFNTEAHPLDPGALLCCSENIYESKKYSRETVRGQKFTPLAKPTPPQNTDDLNSSKDMFGDTRETEEQELPSALANEESTVDTKNEYLHKLRERGAEDLVEVPPPPRDEKHHAAEPKTLLRNMLEQLETMIDISLRKQLHKSSWCRDLLKDLLSVIESKISSHNSVMNESKSSNTEQHFISTEVNKPNEDDTSFVNKDSTFIAQDTPIGQDKSSDKKEYSSSEEKGQVRKHNQFKHVKNKSSNSNSEVYPNGLKEAADKHNEKNLFKLVIVQQFEAIKQTILTEIEVIAIQVNVSVNNLILTRNLIAFMDNENVISQFHKKRLEVMLLVSTINNTTKLTKEFLSSEFQQSISFESFKKLVEILIDGNIIRDFLEKDRNYLEFAKEIITVAKNNHEVDLSKDNDSNIDQDVNKSEEENLNDDSKNLLRADDWKVDEISYQVDDRERVVPVTKVDSGPLFTDKLSVSVESTVNLIPNSLVSSGTVFNAQLLLERIRTNPKYQRNSTWASQYERLTCLPQPYFTRITMSGEFYDD